jgi:hypothetical protein
MRPVLGEIEIKNERREAGSGGGVKGSKFFWGAVFWSGRRRGWKPHRYLEFTDLKTHRSKTSQV